jgi:hypothetical protein
MSIINSSERAALESKLRSVLGAGVATTVLLRLLDHVNASAVVKIDLTPEQQVTLEEAVTEAHPPEVVVVEEPA